MKPIYVPSLYCLFVTFPSDENFAVIFDGLAGGAEEGYHASGRYSHANGYKVDISDAGIYEGGRSYAVLMNALSAYKHQITHEWNLNHFDITIYPEDYDA